MSKYLKIFRLVLFIIFIIHVNSYTKDIQRDNIPAKSTSIDNTTFLNANNILMFVTNHGNFGRDLSSVIGIDAGTWYPYSGDMDDYYTMQPVVYESPLYAAGVWISGKVNGEIRVATSEYASEFVPGPMINDTAQTDRPEFKVYKLYSDSLSDNPNDDYTNWPEDQGAPVDALGQPLMRGDQMLWSVYNDADTAKHVLYATDPLGIEIHQTTIATVSSPTSIFLEYKIYNKSSNSIDSCYFSLWSDPDLGSASDDLIGCDTLDQYFFCYNSDNDDTQYGTAPPTLGFKYVYGPLISSPGDSAYFDGYYIQDNANLPMTSVNKYIGGVDPDDPSEVFNYAKGLDRFGNSILYNGNVTTFVNSGDPVSGIGDLDQSPADRRMMGSAGPFTLAPGDSQFVMIQMAAAQGSNYLNSITQLDNTFSLPFNIPTGNTEDENDNLPTEYTLSQNYPNPFNPTTTIEFSLPKKSVVELTVYNVLGQRVNTILNREMLPGTYKVDWNATDQLGSRVATSVYLYKLKTEEITLTKKMILLK